MEYLVEVAFSTWESAHQHTHIKAERVIAPDPDTAAGAVRELYGTDESARLVGIRRIKSVEPRTTSCGCCTNGCVCWNHRDEPRGIPVTVCGYHQTTPHPRVTSRD